MALHGWGYEVIEANRSAAYRVGAVGFLPKDELLGGALQGLIDG